MSNELVLKRDGVTIVFDAPSRNEKGWLESYFVSLETPGLSARVRVENPPYGSSPTRFFADLAANWRGSKGKNSWRSMDAELDLSAVSDSLGHITITAEVRPDAYPAIWSAKASILVEAGQLEQLHRQFESFFAFEAQQGV